MIHKDDYTFNGEVSEAWCDYAEYVLNDQYLLIFKDYKMDEEHAVEAVTLSEKLKENNKFIGFSMCDKKGEEPEDIKNLPEVEEEVKEEEKDDSEYGRFIALKKLKGPKR